MHRHTHPGSFGPAPMHCWCCGAAERLTGCVHGFPCRCLLFGERCWRCSKCALHCACPQGLLTYEAWRAEHGLPRAAAQEAGQEVHDGRSTGD